MPHALPLGSTFPEVSFPPPGIRWVVFDVVGTLVEPWPAVSVAYQRAAASEGIECRPEELKSSFATAWRRQELIDAAAPTPFATSRAREMERWRGIVHEVFADMALEPVRERIFRALWDHFADPAAWRPLARGTQLVRAAIDAGCGVVLASNFDERLLAIAGRLEPLVHASHVFASSELGWRKPAPAFFREIEKRLGCVADQLILVGDDPRLDVAAARAAGWHAVAIGD